jgi:hypothetical protein
MIVLGRSRRPDWRTGTFVRTVRTIVAGNLAPSMNAKDAVLR